MADRVGEVVESSSTQFLAQCYRLHAPPPLGSLVRVQDDQREILAVVCDASTGPFQPGRRPIARGSEETNEDDLYAHNPQLDKLLRTLFQAQIVGYTTGAGGSDAAMGEGVYQHLPPNPPRIHAFVYACANDEAAQFSCSLDFIHLLVNTSAPAGDELIFACLRYLGQSQQDPGDFLVRAGKELSLLLAGEPQRLSAVLKGLRP